ncbi:substrate-binding domain-containing protein [Tunturiibacter gelidoferens]|jgi:ABC-type phosphate transport system substrate-binding protein|uniref:ABC-type phosphate transport system substrate-binding protein n=1 Tax=Tunturiibacter gelidiferens TaxID=3069689 RepID=A0A9X0QFA3_9BACT|nr:substrate-binding domain-containing protein [Edaphobacter lichenicola]MBB5329386.1 ABC-type phosphate transport system substrate-binding protein [Edaphobacter lichenicola]
MKICAVFTRVFLLLILFVSSGFTQTLQGAGSTLPYPLYSKWFESYRKLHPEVRIHYRPTGSGMGVEELIAGKVDFAGSDTPMPQEQQTKLGPDVLQIPAVLEAVVPVYHVNGVNTELKFTAAALAGIFRGSIESEPGQGVYPISSFTWFIVIRNRTRSRSHNARLGSSHEPTSVALNIAVRQTILDRIVKLHITN